jgi:hypothetical protein
LAAAALRVAAFQVVAYLVRLYFLLIEDVAQRALSRPAPAAVGGPIPCIPCRDRLPTKRLGWPMRRREFIAGPAWPLPSACGARTAPIGDAGGMIRRDRYCKVDAISDVCREFHLSRRAIRASAP